ncbi:efflux RND transporter periplasmic adaptor subunit [Siculibacillus lacustris]|uniref:Efflux RND transporter periplasmic adaptor subunit n=1 Tax=Siculibacillus lacustris TaxID=1549641 RepID=A0A4Q9VN24_9HYPH|nr:efflux RND transporter periplasmic adaptor subunit [Siculibacillus lacustris]TBW36785.1 efflux RND transporter periplasmic adaptor subunit [Siculibacillus lacustris]
MTDLSSPAKTPSRRAKISARTLWLAAGGAVVVAGVGWAIADHYATDPLAGVLTAPAVVGDVELAVLATGTLRPVKLVAVGAQVSGRVTAMKVAVGQMIKAGDLVATIDDVNQQNAAKTARAGLAAVQAQLQEKQATLAYAMSALAREEITLAEKATSRDAYEVAATTAKTTRFQIAALTAQIVQAEVAVATADVDLGYTRIIAPQDGTVLLVVTQEGQTVNAAQSAPTIVILGQVDRMTVRAEISEADVVRVKPGQAVYFTILGDLVTRWDAKLETLDPAPDSIRSDSSLVTASTSSATSSSSSASSAAVYYYGRFDVPNPEGRLKTYMTAQVHVILGAAKGVITVPSSAVSVDAEGGHSVDVVGSDSTIVARAVEIGIDDKIRVEIRSGLKVGEKVVSNRKSAGFTKTTSNRRPPGGL